MIRFIIACSLALTAFGGKPLKTWHIRLEEPLLSTWILERHLSDRHDDSETSVELREEGKLLVLHGPEEALRAVQDTLSVLYREIDLINIHVEAFVIEPDLAKRWGLDGGPPTAPEEVPVKGPLFPMLPNNQAVTLLRTLRTHEGVNCVAVLNGTSVPDATTCTEDTALVRYLANETQVGELTELGASLRYTPSLNPKLPGIIKGDCEFTWTVFAGWAPPQHADLKARIPVIYSSFVETTVTIPHGKTLLITGGTIRIPQGAEISTDFPHNGKVVLWAITTRLIRHHDLFPEHSSKFTIEEVPAE